jgi:osmotically-inducible protein OsmY
MARYDAGWSHTGDSGRYGRQQSQGGWPGGQGRYEDDFGDSGSWADVQGAATYGPSRYGLGPYHERLRKRRRPDDELREDVQEALFYDTWVDSEAISVEVKDGVVTLKGELPSYEEIRYATDDAWDVDGVVGVRSELAIRSS